MAQKNPLGRSRCRLWLSTTIPLACRAAATVSPSNDSTGFPLKLKVMRRPLSKVSMGCRVNLMVLSREASFHIRPDEEDRVRKRTVLFVYLNETPDRSVIRSFHCIGKIARGQFTQAPVVIETFTAKPFSRTGLVRTVALFQIVFVIFTLRHLIRSSLLRVIPPAMTGRERKKRCELHAGTFNLTSTQN